MNAQPIPHGNGGRLAHSAGGVECIAAPDFSAEARAVLGKKKNCRLVKMPNLKKLYAARTKFSASGVTKFVLTNPDCKLLDIDFRGLTPPVPSKALRDWKEKDKDNRKFNN